MSPFALLPSELLTNILLLMEYPDILRCQSVSRTLDKLIRESVAIQYVIELGVSGYVEMPSQKSTLERLELLRLHHTSLTTGSSFIERSTINVSEYAGGNTVILHGYLIIVNRANLENMTAVKIVDLTAVDLPRFCWSVAFTVFSSYRTALEPSQDLIVVYEVKLRQSDALAVAVFHFLCITTGLPHPRSSGHIEFRHPRQYYSSLKVCLSGNYFALTSSSTIFLYDWPSTRLMHEFNVHAFCHMGFISEKHLLLVCVEGQDASAITAVSYDLEGLENDGGVERLAGLPPSRTYEFPAVAPRHHRDSPHIILDCGYQRRPTIDFPFVHDLKQSNLRITVGFHSGIAPSYTGWYVFLVNASTFLSHHGDVTTANSSPPAQRYPWTVWGPRNSCVLSFDSPDQFRDGVFGRYSMFSPHRQILFDPVGARREMRLFSNPEHLAKSDALSMQDETSGKGRSCKLRSGTSHPGVMNQDQHFEHPVVTTAPFYDITSTVEPQNSWDATRALSGLLPEKGWIREEVDGSLTLYGTLNEAL